MQLEYVHKLRSHINRWHKEQPFLFLSSCIALGCIAYYLIILMPLQLAVTQTQEAIVNKQSEFSYMARASRDILRLRALTASSQATLKDSLFAFVNQQINEKNWSNIVTDVRQVDENRVQLTINNISFDSLMEWLKSIYTSSGVFIVEASLERIETGVVKASLVLSAHQR